MFIDVFQTETNQSLRTPQECRSHACFTTNVLRFLLPTRFTAVEVASDFTRTVTRVLDGDTLVVVRGNAPSTGKRRDTVATSSSTKDQAWYWSAVLDGRRPIFGSEQLQAASAQD